MGNRKDTIYEIRETGKCQVRKELVTNLYLTQILLGFICLLLEGVYIGTNFLKGHLVIFFKIKRA